MVAAIRSDSGAARQLLVAVLQGRLALLVSVPLMLEYEAVMTRQEHLAAARLSASDVGDILDAVSSVCTPVHLAFLWRPLLRDANDDMVLETAINGAADQLITFNQRDFRPALQLFALAIKTPGEALRELEAKR